MKHIKIHPADSDEESWIRHDEIVKRLEELGPSNVRAMMGHGLPTQWDPIIRSWLSGEKLDPL